MPTSMTKKDYELIANVIKNHEWIKGRQDMAVEFSIALAKENTRFDYYKFFKACGISEENNPFAKPKTRKK